MATDFTEEGAADAVIESFAGTPDERLRTILDSLVQHLHAAVRADAAPVEHGEGWASILQVIDTIKPR